MTKQSEIQAIKEANPSLNRFDAGVEIQLTGAEYDAQIDEIWRLTKKSETLAKLEMEKSQAKSALLEKLGITENEAQLLLS
jgi:hypothetical protein